MQKLIIYWANNHLEQTYYISDNGKLEIYRKHLKFALLFLLASLREMLDGWVKGRWESVESGSEGQEGVTIKRPECCSTVL